MTRSERYLFIQAALSEHRYTTLVRGPEITSGNLYQCSCGWKGIGKWHLYLVRRQATKDWNRIQSKRKKGD